MATDNILKCTFMVNIQSREDGKECRAGPARTIIVYTNESKTENCKGDV